MNTEIKEEKDTLVLSHEGIVNSFNCRDISYELNKFENYKLLLSFYRENLQYYVLKKTNEKFIKYVGVKDLPVIPEVQICRINENRIYGANIKAEIDIPGCHLKNPIVFTDTFELLKLSFIDYEINNSYKIILSYKQDDEEEKSIKPTVSKFCVR